ncbi:helix-turn-helix domain-containing protein, partial [Collinsella intestinalis]
MGRTSVPIVMRLDRVMADRKMSSLELAEKVGISPVNISR